jgi:hypothetical protein
MGTRFLKRVQCFSSKQFLFILGVSVLVTLVTGLNPVAIFAQTGVDNASATGVFQLEGNALRDTDICFRPASGGTAPSIAPYTGTCPSGFTHVQFGANTDDWQNVFNGTAHTAVTSFAADVTGAGDNILTQPGGSGGAKDVNDFNLWTWKTGKAEAKSDIAHALAAAYTLANGHTGLYFAMDRFDNSGDATAGFWLVQDPNVGPNNSGGFNGTHMEGDLLIVSDFSQGGAVSTINIFTWHNGALTFDTSRSPAPCDPTTGNSTICGLVNPIDGVANGGWGFKDKSGFSTYLTGEFLEVGIDLNAVFPNAPCFTTFFSETRSANSLTASGVDFTAPVPFRLCSISNSKSCNGNGVVSSDGSSVAYSWSGTVTNTGQGTLYDVDVLDTLPDGTPTTIHVITSSTTPNKLVSGASATYSVSFVATSANCHSGVTNCTSPLSATNTSSAKAATSEGGAQTILSPAPNSTAPCSTNVSSTIDIHKHCDAANGGATLVALDGVVKVKVFYTAHVCNTGTAGVNSQLTNITLVDEDAANITDSPNPSTISSLNPGQCADVAGSYFPSSIDSSTGRYGFTDTIRVTSAKATLGSNPTPVAGCPDSHDLACAPITCPICFDSVCTGLPQP